MEKVGRLTGCAPNSTFWQGRKVVVTGHTGFKGAWLSLWLSKMGAKVLGIALPPPTSPSLYELADVGSIVEEVLGDIKDMEFICHQINEWEPEIIFHLAAQSLVRESYEEPLETIAINVMGTAHILEAARRQSSVKTVVNITTDKCYENKEWIWGYREIDALGGSDPYSASKACAELISVAYQKSFLQSEGVAIATARSGNVVGGGDWATDRLVPDIFRAYFKNQKLRLRYPDAVRPWQHVLEPLSGYLQLAERLHNDADRYSGAWNFGPSLGVRYSVTEILEKLQEIMGANITWEVLGTLNEGETNWLQLDSTKAQLELNWSPTWDIDLTLAKVVDWYEAWNRHEDMQHFTLSQIVDYMNAATSDVKPTA